VEQIEGAPSREKEILHTRSHVICCGQTWAAHVSQHIASFHPAECAMPTAPLRSILGVHRQFEDGMRHLLATDRDREHSLSGGNIYMLSEHGGLRLANILLPAPWTATMEDQAAERVADKAQAGLFPVRAL
jgi:hypothetical protein